jgi:hypothetical protein
MMAIFEVFYQPGKLFASLPNRRGVWVLPLIVGMLLSLATTISAVHVIGMDTIVRQQIENQRNMSPEQMQQALNNANSPAIQYLIYGVVVLAGIFLPLIVSGGLSVFALMGNQQPKFGTMFSMVTLAYLPYTVIASLMTILVLLATTDTSVLDINNLLSTNVAAFMNKETTGKGLYAFLSSVDILSFFEIGLLGYGFSKVTKSSFFFGLFSVGSLWAVYVVVKVGLSLLRS